MVPLRHIPDAVFIDESNTYVDISPRFQIPKSIIPRWAPSHGDLGLVERCLDWLAENVGSVLYDSMGYRDIAVPLCFSEIRCDFNGQVFSGFVCNLYRIGTVG